MKIPVYLSEGARKLFPSGLVEVIPDVEVTQPPPEVKKPRSQRQIMRGFQRQIWKRAKARGLVSQTEMLARLEDEMEHRMDDWEIFDGSDAGGSLEEP